VLVASATERVERAFFAIFEPRFELTCKNKASTVTIRIINAYIIITEAISISGAYPANFRTYDAKVASEVS
jgi:hypothetical protein